MLERDAPLVDWSEQLEPWLEFPLWCRRLYYCGNHGDVQAFRCDVVIVGHFRDVDICLATSHVSRCYDSTPARGADHASCPLGSAE